MLVRIGLMIAALVVAACLVVTLRAIRLEADARTALESGGTPIAKAAIAQAEDLLKSAAELNPDVRPEMVRAALLTGVNEPRRAVAILRDVLRREPENAVALSLLLRNLRNYDAGAAQAAQRRILEVAPAVPGS